MGESEELVTMPVRVPRALLEDFQKAIKNKYATVSEAVRDLMRKTIEQGA